jgi:hypothetical protein
MKLPRRAHLLMLAVAMLLTALVYVPGLSGAWLVDDESNLGAFSQYEAGAAPYRELIFSNNSGPLGRSVSMASFALNHTLGLFSTTALKATNLGIHLACGLLLYLLLAQLFRLRNPTATVAAPLLAALLTAWWLLLPQHINTVLYIVQRMAQLAALFSLAACLSYVRGRAALQAGNPRGYLGIALALALFLPLAMLAKETGILCLGWLALIEVFFFRRSHPSLQPGRVLLIASVLAGSLIAAVAIFSPHFFADGYLLRDFTLHERLLTQPRVLFTYIGNIFLPDSATMGLFHDDFVVSQSLLSPWTTLPALLLLFALLGLGIRLANSPRWWPVSFGLFFYFAGHLLESSFIALELYFEHRNYLPAAGLLLAIVPVLGAWPWRRQLLALVLGLYFSLLSVSALQTTQIWGRNDLLLAVSARNHPHSLRAWSDYAEDLLAMRQPQRALEAVALTAERNPRFAAISYLHMLTIYCRLHRQPPPEVIATTASGIATLDTAFATPLSIGLDNVLGSHRAGHCGNADFSAFGPALIAQDRRLVEHLGDNRGRLWVLRFNIAEWLIDTGHEPAARDILRDIWNRGDRRELPMPGLILAKTLNHPGFEAEKRKVLDELEAVTSDAPADFRAQMNALRQEP